MEKNKYKIIQEIFNEHGDGSSNDMLNLMMAFDILLEKGFIEQFTNINNEIDYRLTGRVGTLELMLDKNNVEDLGY